MKKFSKKKQTNKKLLNATSYYSSLNVKIPRVPKFFTVITKTF